MPNTADVREEIARSRAEWLARLGAGDLDGYLGVMAPEVVWLPPHGPALEGVGALRTWLAPFLKQHRYEFSVFDVQFRAAGAWAFERGRYRSVVVLVDGGAPLAHEGQYVLFWRRELDGRWRIERYADSTALGSARVEERADHDRAT